jgi:hypothetical protein
MHFFLKGPYADVIRTSIRSVRIEYGITPAVNTRSFADMYFGEFVLLFKAATDEVAPAP